MVFWSTVLPVYCFWTDEYIWGKWQEKYTGTLSNSKHIVKVVKKFENKMFERFKHLKLICTPVLSAYGSEHLLPVWICRLR
jgi:hypothetical protein